MIRTVLAALCASTLLTAEAQIRDFSGVQHDLAGRATQVLVLGTAHLNQLPEEAFAPEHLSLVLERLEAFDPDIIAIESVNGRTCDMLVQYEPLYPDVADTYCREPEMALETLGLTIPQAFAAALTETDALDETATAAERRRLAALWYGAGEPWTAGLQWAKLSEADRIEDESVSEALKETLDKMLLSRNENNQIGIELAERLGLETLLTMDDHSADFVLARAPETLWPTMQEVWGQENPEADAVLAEGQQYFGSADRVLLGYRFMNSVRYQDAIIANDFGAAASTAKNDAVSRQYLAWYQARGLRMAANVIEGAGNQPGARVLVIVGASHKSYFDAYLDQMHDVEIISVDDVLSVEDDPQER